MGENKEVVLSALGMTQVTQDDRVGGLGSHRSTWAERWQSLKVGGLGAIAAALTVGVFILMHGWLLVPRLELSELPTWRNGSLLLIDAAIATVSGFLFAVTYRYVVRHEQNPHLKSGAVGAFGLVRGLAQLESELQTLSPVILSILVLESLLLFGLVRIVLDWAFAKGWVCKYPIIDE